MPDLDESTDVTQVVTPSPTPAAQVPADDFDKDRAMETIRKLRDVEKNAKAQAKELAELKAEREQREQAELSETDRLKKQLADALSRESAAAARLNAELIKSAAASAATALQLPFAGATALDDAVSLGAFADLEIGADGKVSGMNDAIKALHKARPYLFGTSQPQSYDINAGARGSGTQSKQDIEEANRRRILTRGARY